jgi:predicted O-methyltransferase YrrM
LAQIAEYHSNWPTAESSSALTQQHQSFDLVFTDAWADKYDGLDDVLALVRRGGFFIGDEMLPQSNWQENHQERAEGLASYLEGLSVRL